MSESTGWDALLHWAKIVAEHVDIDGEERDYKTELAAKVKAAMTSAEDEVDGWNEELRRALQSANLLNSYFMMAFTYDLRNRTSEVRHALTSLWHGDPDPLLLDEFFTRLRPLNPQRYASGAAIAAGSVVLMARDPGQFPPFRARAVAGWFKLTGGTLPPSDAAPSARYGAFLNLLDELLSRAVNAGVQLRDRLDGQGLLWALTQWPLDSIDRDESWPDSQVRNFRLWRGEPDADDQPEPGAQRAWLVRPRQGGPDLVLQWVTGGFVSLAARHLPPVGADPDLPTVRTAVDQGYQHQDYAQRLDLASEYYDFLTRMSEGDIVATVADGVLRVGALTGPAGYTDAEWSRLRRPVSWSDSTVAIEDLPTPLPSLLDGQGTVVDLTAGIDALLHLAPGQSAPADPNAPDEPPPLVDAAPTFPPASGALAARTHLPTNYLQSLLDLLHDRQQFVFYGPPGTGKTYLARELARHIVGSADSSRARLVQFHPSYSYEDFFEGFRPSETPSGQATFKLVPGPLRRLASEARDNPGEPFVLIIDEMNRANIAKVFGELYFLLEYRDAAIALQYNPTESFRLPRNLFVIGTMNTADRSIALVDAAIRRRFPFVELHPETPPIDGLLRRFLAANDRSDELARLLAALNDAFDDNDRDFQIGPSYLMRPEARTTEGLERIWQYDVLPLLQEHYYGRLSPAEIQGRFGLRALRARIGESSPWRPAEGGPGWYPMDLDDQDRDGEPIAPRTDEAGADPGGDGSTSEDPAAAGPHSSPLQSD